MPGPWKAWKTRGRFSTLSTAPWKSRKPGEIPTFPQLRRGGMGKWKTKTRFPTFPRTPGDYNYGFVFTKPKDKEDTSAAARLADPEFSGSFTIGNKCRFQAHLVLESNLDFRLIFGLENAVTPHRRNEKIQRS